MPGIRFRTSFNAQLTVFVSLTNVHNSFIYKMFPWTQREVRGCWKRGRFSRRTVSWANWSTAERIWNVIRIQVRSSKACGYGATVVLGEIIIFINWDGLSLAFTSLIIHGADPMNSDIKRLMMGSFLLSNPLLTLSKIRYQPRYPTVINYSSVGGRWKTNSIPSHTHIVMYDNIQFPFPSPSWNFRNAGRSMRLWIKWKSEWGWKACSSLFISMRSHSSARLGGGHGTDAG